MHDLGHLSPEINGNLQTYISFPVSAQLVVFIAVHFNFSFYLTSFTNIIIMGLHRWLGARLYTVLLEDCSSGPYTHVRQLTTPSDLSSRESNILFWTAGITCIMYIYTQTHNTIKNLIKQLLFLPPSFSLYLM